MTAIKPSNSALVVLFLTIGIVSNNVIAESRYYETEGVADIMKDTTFTYGTEVKNVPIPRMIEVRFMSEYSEIYIEQQTKSGWARCIVPLKSEFGFTGVVNRYMSFKCKPSS